MRTSILAKQEAFKNARFKKGLTLTSLAKEINYSRKHLTLIANGHTGAGPNLAVKIAEKLDVEFDSIWDVK